VRPAFGQPRVTGDVDVVEEERATFLNRFNGDRGRDGWITGPQARAPKRLDMIAVRFGSDEFTVGGATPKVDVAGMEKGAGEGAKRPEEMAGIAALKSGPGELQKKVLESLIRLRRLSGPRISCVNCQCAPFA
jgi:hypothetical protein